MLKKSLTIKKQTHHWSFIIALIDMVVINLPNTDRCGSDITDNRSNNHISTIIRCH
jgi:hypothetical protein